MHGHEIAGSLRAFAAERAPAGVVLALSTCLCAGPWALAGGDALALARSVGVVFLVLIVLRIADDVRSVEHDRIVSPERVLPAGKVGVRALRPTVVSVARQTQPAIFSARAPLVPGTVASVGSREQGTGDTDTRAALTPALYERTVHCGFQQ